jgi:hypothetical protein
MLLCFPSNLQVLFEHPLDLEILHHKNGFDERMYFPRTSSAKESLQLGQKKIEYS